MVTVATTLWPGPWQRLIGLKQAKATRIVGLSLTVLTAVCSCVLNRRNDFTYKVIIKCQKGYVIFVDRMTEKNVVLKKILRKGRKGRMVKERRIKKRREEKIGVHHFVDKSHKTGMQLRPRHEFYNQGWSKPKVLKKT